MIRLLFFRFWPALLPLVIYIIWHRLAVRRAKKAGKPVPHFRDGPIYWMVMSCLVIAVLCFALLGFDMEAQRGDYVPPSLQNGMVVPGYVEP